MLEAAEIIEAVNSVLNGFVWGPFMIAFIMAVGVWFTFSTGFFQVRKIKLWMNSTLLAIFRKDGVRETCNGGISQFQSLSTALAGTLGTGSIAGVATAVVLGGPGALFWMWVSAFFGMMTSFAENVLGIIYRGKNRNGEWVGGAMVYLEKGLKCKPLAVMFAFFCMLASFGIGNMTQANSIAQAMESSFHVPVHVTGVAVAAVITPVIIGGIKRIAVVTEKVVPFMAVAYITGCMVVLCVNIKNVPAAFGQIFEGAFSFSSVGGGASGFFCMKALRYGVARGVFSNEAGLGSSVMVHAASNVKEPVQQGMWGIFEVFVDTIVVCTITGLVILSSGVYAQNINPLTGEALLDGVPLTSAAFASGLGRYAGWFVSVSIVLFAFSTLLGWSYYGERSVSYLFGEKFVPIYKVIFVFFTVVGSVSQLRLVWSVSDTFNGFMAIPNLIGITLLSGVVLRETRRYLKEYGSGKRRSEKA